jgi:uncharacterized protein DUF1360
MPMTFIILTLATMRLTRVIVLDKITQPVRKLAVAGFSIKIRKWHLYTWRGSGIHGWLSYLIHCVFCAGFWAATIVITSHILWPHNKWLNAAYLILAIAEIAPRLLNWEPRTSNTGGE